METNVLGGPCTAQTDAQSALPTQWDLKNLRCKCITICHCQTIWPRANCKCFRAKKKLRGGGDWGWLSLILPCQRGRLHPAVNSFLSNLTRKGFFWRLSEKRYFKMSSWLISCMLPVQWAEKNAATYTSKAGWDITLRSRRARTHGKTFWTWSYSVLWFHSARDPITLWNTVEFNLRTLRECTQTTYSIPELHKKKKKDSRPRLNC